MTVTKSEQAFVDLIGGYISGAGTNDVLLDSGEWNHVFSLARMHHVLPMIYSYSHRNPSFCALPQGRRTALKNACLTVAGAQVLRHESFLKIYDVLRSGGINVLAVKGIICRLYYPEPDCRISTDEDLYIRPCELELCDKLLCGAGLTREGELRKSGDTLYFNPQTGVRIELHTNLFDHSSPRFAEMDSWFSDSFSRSVGIDFEGRQVFTMNCTDHALYLICHSLKHFVVSGFGIRQICDIVLFCKKYAGEIDWNYVFSKLKSVRGEIFFANVITLGTSMIGCEPGDLGIDLAPYSGDINTDDMLSDILCAGIYGTSSLVRQHSGVMTKSAFDKNGSGVSVVNAVFPKRTMLEGKYTYLKKAPFLLPVAWIQRVCTYLVHRSAPERRDGSMRDISKLGHSRTRLLSKYKVID